MEKADRLRHLDHQTPLRGQLSSTAMGTPEVNTSRRVLEAIAAKLLARIVMSETPGVPSSGDELTALWEEPPPALADFDLKDRDGRLNFLWALFHHHYRHGLFLAVQHVWASLARPKAARCQIMAQRLRLTGTGKTALKNVLAAFLQEMLYGVDFPALPNLSSYSDSVSWNAACQAHFASINRSFEIIVRRYEAVLDGAVQAG